MAATVPVLRHMCLTGPVVVWIGYWLEALAALLTICTMQNNVIVLHGTSPNMGLPAVLANGRSAHLPRHGCGHLAGSKNVFGSLPQLLLLPST